MAEAQARLATNTEAILILSPTGQDSFLLTRALSKEQLEAVVFRDMAALCRRLREQDSGALLLAEEALTREALDVLNQTLLTQPPWSDIPLIVMTGSGETTISSLRVLKAVAPIGNVTLLERPFRAITLMSTLRVALRARKRQYQVRELLEQQLQATRIRDEFISIASHELKTPLTSLKLQTQLNQKLMRDLNPAAFSPTRIAKLINQTGSQVDRLTRLVEDMLDVSRIHSGKLSLTLAPFDLATLAHELAERFQPQFEAAGCAFALDAPEPVFGVWDHFRLEQVVNNLLTNAIRYSPGCPITLRVSQEEGFARLSVQDEGRGIAPENQDRIFQRFERAVPAENISGLGLGLYISRQIMEAHKGTIAVRSKPGHGSTFTIELPARSAS